MTDIVLDDIASGYNLNKLNVNFTKIETAINTEILHTVGGNNTMQQALDMNGFPILNLDLNIVDVEGGISEAEGDLRYVNVTGDTMTGSLNILTATTATHPIRKDQFDSAISSVNTSLGSINAEIDALTDTVNNIEVDYVKNELTTRSASYTLQPSDHNVFAEVSGNVTITLPPDSQVNLTRADSSMFMHHVRYMGGGVLTVEAGAGVSIIVPFSGTNTCSELGQTFTVCKSSVSTNRWHLFGQVDSV